QSLMDTLKSYTADNAWVEFNEARKGRLVPGMMADIVIMSHDLTAMDPESLDNTRARMTIMGGRVTYEA
ncbi:amidohydrolase family protein, partial [Cribrihabitans sp. XS_ASV171]